jgi:hypothetical protein
VAGAPGRDTPIGGTVVSPEPVLRPALVRKDGPHRDPPTLIPTDLRTCCRTLVSLMHDTGLSAERIGDHVSQGSTHMGDRFRHLLE